MDQPLLSREEAENPANRATGPHQLYYVVEGRPAEVSGEMVLDEGAAEERSLGLGDSFDLAGMDRTVTGIARGIGYSEQTAFLAPGSIMDTGEVEILIQGLAWFDSADDAQAALRATSHLREGNKNAVFYQWEGDGGLSIVEPAMLLVILMSLAAVVCAAAWTTGFGRRLSAAALARVVGSEPRQLVAPVVLQAVVIASLGVTSAWLVFAGTSFVAARQGPGSWGVGSQSVFQSWFLLMFFLHMAIAMLTSGLAAWLPTRQLEHSSIAAGLAGRVSHSPASGRGAWRGGGLVIIGLVLFRLAVHLDTNAMIALGMLGTAAVAAAVITALPWVVENAVTALPDGSAPWRLAKRSVISNRQRSVGFVILIGVVTALTTIGLLDNAGQLRFYSSTNQSEMDSSAGLILLLSFGFLGGCLTLLGLLQRSEDAGRRAVLHALGAGPGLDRLVVGWTGTLLGSLAVGLGIPLGLLVHLAVETQTPRLVVPWAEIAVLLLIPLLVGVITFATTGGSGRTRRPGQRQPATGAPSPVG